MNFNLIDFPPKTSPAHRPDWGYVITVAGLIFAAIQAHRYWRATIRLEDELEAFRKDTAFTLDRFEQAFRSLAHPLAFVDRHSGRVAQATPGWIQAGLPEPGSSFAGADEALAAAWAAIPAPDAEGRVAEARFLKKEGQSFRAQPLEGASLGLVLVQPE